MADWSAGPPGICWEIGSTMATYHMRALAPYVAMRALRLRLPVRLALRHYAGATRAGVWVL